MREVPGRTRGERLEAMNELRATEREKEKEICEKCYKVGEDKRIKLQINEW